MQGTEEIDVTICSLDNPDVTPEFHIWVEYQLSWLKKSRQFTMLRAAPHRVLVPRLSLGIEFTYFHIQAKSFDF